MHIIITRGELIWIHIRACRRAFAMKCSRRLTVSVKMLDLFRYMIYQLSAGRAVHWTVPGVCYDQLSYKMQFHS